jgi:hypothetical protein
VSSRWSYGPEGLRERPATRWSEAELWPRWRELQPLLIRSAGVVGLVAIIMAVASSDAFRLGDGASTTGGAESSAPAPEPVPTPIIAAASELESAGAAEAATAPEQVVAAEEGESAPLSVEAPPAIVTAPAVPDLRSDEPAAQPAAVAMLSEPHPQPVAENSPAPMETVPIADLRTDRMPMPPHFTGASAPLTTASLSASEMALADESPQAVAQPSAAEPALATGTDAASGTETPAPATEQPSIWPQDAASCPRDWVATHTASDAASGDRCSGTADLIASVADGDRSALQDAAAVRAESLAMLAPRIPLPRPEIVPRSSRRRSVSAAPPTGRPARRRTVAPVIARNGASSTARPAPRSGTAADLAPGRPKPDRAYLENALYLILCGSTASAPSRRFLSSS